MTVQTLKMTFKRPQVYVSLVLIILVPIVGLILGPKSTREILTPVQGFISLYKQSPLTYLIFLIWPSIPLATLYLEHKQDNLLTYILIRMGASQYYNFLFIFNFVFVFFTSVAMLSILFLPSIGYFTGTIEDAMRFDDGYFRDYSKYMFEKPYHFLSLFIMYKSFAAAVFASVALAFSYFIQNLYFVYLSVFLLNALLSISGHYLSTLKLAPYFAAAPYALSNYAIGAALLTLLGYLILSYIVPRLYFMKDYR